LITSSLPVCYRRTKNSNTVTLQACCKRRLRRVSMRSTIHYCKNMSLLTNEKIFCFGLFCLSSIPVITMDVVEVAQRTLHLCFLCDSFPQVARNTSSAITAVLATKSDRMMIYCLPAMHTLHFWQDVTIL
jgi:hypothetical protein